MLYRFGGWPTLRAFFAKDGIPRCSSHQAFLPTDPRGRSLTASAHQGSPSGFGMAGRGGWVFVLDSASRRMGFVSRTARLSRTRSCLSIPSRADKHLKPNTTPTQRPAVPRAEHQLCRIIVTASVRPEESAPLLSRRVQSRANA
jgi:hypothetical protein